MRRGCLGRVSSSLTRRAVLRAGLALPLAAACTDGAPAPPPPPDPDIALRAAAAERERALLAAYDAAVLAAPSLAGRIAAVRAEHAQHAAAVAGPAAATNGPRSTDATPGASPSPSPVRPRDAAAVLAELVAAERDAATRHASDALLSSRELAAVLASLAASEAAHVVALT